MDKILEKLAALKKEADLIKNQTPHLHAMLSQIGAAIDSGKNHQAAAAAAPAPAVPPAAALAAPAVPK